MGLFSLFSKKESGPVMKDQIWMSHSAKLKGSLKLIRENPNAIMIAWFTQTQKEFEQFFKTQNGIETEIKLAKSVSSMTVSNKPIIFLEHHPLRNKEENLIQNWNAQKIFVLSSLDEPLFEKFGSNNIIAMMKQLGMQEDEMLEHAMINKSIERAQHKLEKKVTMEKSAESSQEWFKKNVISETRL